MSKRKVYTVEEVAEAWGRHPRTVYRWLAEGRLLEGVDYERVKSPGDSRGHYALWSTCLPGLAFTRG